MSLDKIKAGIAASKFKCPQCGQPIKQFEKYVDTIGSVWDGAGDSLTESSGSKVTLICATGTCGFKERTEYWEEYLDS